MLETDDVDDDYFTPVASTSLANIFGKSSDGNVNSENKTLKYTAPKPQIPPRPEDAQDIERVFVCAFVGHQWVNTVYTSKGRIGCAIVKVNKTKEKNFHMILYDSNKTTLSTTTLSSDLQVTLKESEFISFYDNNKKYWSLYGSEDDIKKILEYLKTAHVNIRNSDQQPSEPPLQSTVINEQVKNIIKTDSDTDSSVIKKSKASILNRMANMGQSVLPNLTIPKKQTSDSSPSSETDNDIKTTRHKPTKNIKRNVELTREIDVQQITVPAKVDNSHVKPVFDNTQLIPLPNNTIHTTSIGGDFNFFITEQRISNSEFRINLGRLSDKVDQISDKLNQFDNKNTREDSSSFNTEILQKLLREYESKIKNYGELFKKMNTTANMEHKNVSSSDYSDNTNERSMMKNKIMELEASIQQKDLDLSILSSEIETIKRTDTCNPEHAKQNEKELLGKISDLKQKLLAKNELLTNLTLQNVDLTTKSQEAGNQIKTVMNDTFHAIAANFKDGETYSGETIKNTIAAVIRQVTRDSLSKT